MSEKTVVVGLSGGVDSSVAALLLKRQGWKVIGLFMKNWEDDDTEEYCSSRQDLVDVMSVADRIGIDVEVVNFSAEYRERVFAEFLREYQAGRTPNPDILCNSEIKFKAFLDHALTLGADKIATGHYAGVREFDGEFQLLKAEDGTKDQSYFLYRLNQAQLSKTLFPLADLYKREVRKIAEAEGLHVAAKKDSTGICFIGERPFKDFLAALPAAEAGRNPPPRRRQGARRARRPDVSTRSASARVCISAASRKRASPGGGDHDAWFVAGKDMEKNVLYVVQGHDHPALFRSSLVAEQLSWVSRRAPHTHWVYTAKPRYRTAEQACEIERIDAGSCEINFAEPQWALTPGQSVVLYESRVCLGGGVIR